MLNPTGKFWWGCLVFLGCSLLFSACSKGEQAPAEPIKIDTLFAYTGDLATTGPELRNAADLAAKHINLAGGVLGAQLALVHKDTGTNRDIAEGNALRLVEEEKVSAIVGAQSSGVTIHVAMSVTIPGQVVLISPSSTSPDITTLEDNDFVFRTAPSDALQGVILARLARELGFDSAATIYVDNAYGQGLSSKFKEEFTQKGGEVLAAVPHVSAPEINEPTYVSELRTATVSEPDVLIAISYPESTKMILKEAILEGFITKFLFVDGNKSPAVIKAIGPRYLNGSFGTAPGFGDTDASNFVVTSYYAEYNEIPDRPYFTGAYDAVVLLALAIEKAGEAEGPAIREAIREVANPPGERVGPGPEGLRRALELVRDGIEINYEGAAGPHDFDRFGDVITPIEVWKIEDGKIKTVRHETP